MYKHYKKPPTYLETRPLPGAFRLLPGFFTEPLDAPGTPPTATNREKGLYLLNARPNVAVQGKLTQTHFFCFFVGEDKRKAVHAPGGTGGRARQDKEK